MAVVNDKEIFINILLENDTDSYGNIKYVMCPLPPMNPENYNKIKLMSILSPLAVCFSKSIGLVHKIEGGKISNC